MKKKVLTAAQIVAAQTVKRYLITGVKNSKIITKVVMGLDMAAAVNSFSIENNIDDNSVLSAIKQ